jgi:hypothetical protein
MSERKLISLKQIVSTRISKTYESNEFQNGYQPRSNLVKDANGYWIADFQQYFEQTEELLLSGIEC